MRKVFLLFLLLVSNLLGFSQEAATPLEGEGIYAFLRRCNVPESLYNQFVELNKDKLGRDNSLILNVTYLLPSIDGADLQNDSKIGAVLKEPLFGKEYEEYEIKSNRLNGACFFLVGGHGGPDCGAVTKIDGHVLHEDEYAYDIILRLARNLLQEGATVHIIIQDEKDGIRNDKYLENSKRETCMGEKIPSKQTSRLRQRCDKINALSAEAKEKYQRALFVHLDSRGEKEQLDVYFFFQERESKSKEFAETLRDTMRAQYQKHQPNRGFSGTVSMRALYVLNNTKPVSVFAELANMQNHFDRNRYLIENNRQALANWLTRGIIADYENSK